MQAFVSAGQVKKYVGKPVILVSYLPSGQYMNQPQNGPALNKILLVLIAIRESMVQSSFSSLGWLNLMEIRLSESKRLFTKTSNPNNLHHYWQVKKIARLNTSNGTRKDNSELG